MSSITVILSPLPEEMAMEETLYLLSSPKNRKHLLDAIKNQGKGAVTFKSRKEIEKFFSKS